MKRLLIFILCSALLLALVSCGGDEKTAFEISEAALDKTEMSKVVFNDTQITAYENRFTKIDLKDKVARLINYKTTTNYAMVIELDSNEAAQTLYDFVSTGGEDIVIKDNVVVYGKHSSIKDIFK